MQRSALLDAARTLLSEGGTEALTFPALAERTGLARSSVYEYFRSRAAVVEELCAVDFPVWAAEIESAMERAPDPAGKVEAYVRQQLALVGDQRHRAVVAISAGELDTGAREKIRAAHGGLIAMIVEALEALHHDQPRLAAMLLQGWWTRRCGVSRRVRPRTPPWWPTPPSRWLWAVSRADARRCGASARYAFPYGLRAPPPLRDPRIPRRARRR